MYSRSINSSQQKDNKKIKHSSNKKTKHSSIHSIHSWNVFLYFSLEIESTMSVICFIRLLASGWEVKCPWFNQITNILKAQDQAIKILFYWKIYVQLSIILMNFDIFRTLSWFLFILSCYNKWEKKISFKCFVISCNSLFKITTFK